MRSRTVREGTVGLFAILGLVIFAGITFWLRGGRWGERSYQILVEFDNVSGLQAGAPVTYRGVRVGRVTNLQPQAGIVVATIEISSSQMRIPRQGIRIQTNRFGLVGEASVDITSSFALPPEAEKINPLREEECNQATTTYIITTEDGERKEVTEPLILCNNSLIAGVSGAQLVESLTQLAETYGDPEFINNFARTFTHEARLNELSRDLSALSQTTEQEVSNLSQDVSRTSASINRTADDASLLLGNVNSILLENRENINTTFAQATQLINTANALVEQNRQQIEETIVQVNYLSKELTVLAANLNKTTTQINSTLEEVDSKQVIADVQVIMDNARLVSENLKQASETLNDPATILILQQTLDSARATFQNAEKITADVDDLIGDPQFREQLRRLVNGLSNLVSSSQTLEKQIKTAQELESINQQLSQQLENNPELRGVEPTQNQDNIIPSQISRNTKKTEKTPHNSQIIESLELKQPEPIKNQKH